VDQSPSFLGITLLRFTALVGRAGEHNNDDQQPLPASKAFDYAKVS